MINLEKMVNDKLSRGTIKCNTDTKETISVMAQVLDEVLTFMCDTLQEQDKELKELKRLIEQRNI